MAAFVPFRTNQIKQVIRRLGNRIINSHRTDVTADELFELYTKPQDHEVLTRVFDLVQLDTSISRIQHPFNVEGGAVTLQIYLDFTKIEKKWLVPRYSSKGMVAGAHMTEAGAKLTKWVAKRIALGRECALVEAVFDELNWRCNAAGLKFFMPSVLDFLDMIEDDKRAAEQREKLSMARVPALPALPRAMIDVLPQIKATVARARLMDKKSEDVVYGKVRFAISASSKGLGETPWGTTLTIY